MSRIILSLLIQTVHDLIEPYLAQGHALLIQLLQILDFAGLQENDGLALVATARRPAHPVNVVHTTARRIVLNDAVQIGHVNAPGGHVRADENAPGALAELFQDLGAPVLVHVAVEREDVAHFVLAVLPFFDGLVHEVGVQVAVHAFAALQVHVELAVQKCGQNVLVELNCVVCGRENYNLVRGF